MSHKNDFGVDSRCLIVELGIEQGTHLRFTQPFFIHYEKVSIYLVIACIIEKFGMLRDCRIVTAQMPITTASKLPSTYSSIIYQEPSLTYSRCLTCLY
jgi:hypothetical protein